MPTYVARVWPDGTIRVYRDHVQVAVLELPDSTSLRETLEAAGWRPTGRRAPSGGWGSIYVEPITPRRS